MRAVVYERYGGVEVMKVVDRPVPRPGPGEVLVRVHATSVNDWDWGMLRGKPFFMRLLSGLIKPKTPVLGTEVAGVIEAKGEGTRRFELGDRVYGDLSDAGFGGYAEYVSVRENALYQMHPEMSYEQAATLPHAGLLALQGLVGVGNIRQGESVLINGAGGGVGAIALGIAKTYGCHVTGVDHGSKLSALRDIGYDETLNYEQVDFTASDKRYDLVLDAKTMRSPGRYLKALKPAGRYVTVGGHLKRLLQVACFGLFIRQMTGKRIALLSLKPNQGLDTLNDLFESGALNCVIDGPYDLADVPVAMERFGREEHIGKLVISVRH